MIGAMSDTDPQMEIVSDVLFEKRGDGWLFQVATSGAVSYLSTDGRLGWRGLAPAAAIEANLHRGQLAECKTGAAPAELTLTFHYPRLPVTETMTVRLLESPAAMTIDRVLHNAGQTPLKVHEVRMLAVDAGGLLFGDVSPTDLRCVYVGDIRKSTGAAPAPLPQPARTFGDLGEDSSPALAICNADLTTYLLEIALQQDPFAQMWQIKASKDWQPGRPVSSDYAAISRDPRRQPLLLSPGQRQAVSSLFYQVKAGYDLRTLYDDGLAECKRRGQG
jgi:hypothetical protein